MSGEEFNRSSVEEVSLPGCYVKIWSVDNDYFKCSEIDAGNMKFYKCRYCGSTTSVSNEVQYGLSHKEGCPCGSE